MSYRKWIFLQAVGITLMQGYSEDAMELPACPNSPNCVSSSAVDPSHHVEPFPIFINGKKSIDLLFKIIKNLPRTKIIELSDNYLHTEFESRIFRFIDDVEFLANEDQKIIEVRSAARVGYGDFGVNRKRIEMLRALYLEEVER